MKMGLRIFFTLLFCFMGFSGLNMSIGMVKDDMTPFSNTLNQYVLRGMIGKIDEVAKEIDNKRSYIESQGLTDEVDNRMEELVSFEERHLPEKNQFNASLGKVGTLFLGYLLAFFYLLIVIGLFVPRFRSIKIAWAAVIVSFSHYIFVLNLPAMINVFLLAEWSPRVIAVRSLIDPSFEGRAFAMSDAIKSIFYIWPMHLIFIIYLVIFIFYFRSSLYMDKEKAE